MSPNDRAAFETTELAVVLSHYDLGTIESITDFPRGSRRSPKVGIVSRRGKFLLKRRDIRRARPERVRFAHDVQWQLSMAGCPTPKLLRTRSGGRTMLRIKEYVYELFEFIAGEPYSRTPGEARDAGEVLAQFHRATDTLELNDSLVPLRGHFHDAQGVRTGLCSIGTTLSSHDSFSGDEAELATLVQFLLAAYDQSAESVNALGFLDWPERIIHSDWHPGNLLFRNKVVVAVVDYDALRLSRCVIDVANGALQFSIVAGGDPATWPDHLDEACFRAFLSGYESSRQLLDSERAALPPLMAEALIAECVPPITETGSMGRWAGYRVLQMVRRKLEWLKPNAQRLMDESKPRVRPQ